METTLTMPLQKVTLQPYTVNSSVPVSLASQKTSRLEKYLVTLAKQVTLFYLACITIKKPLLIIKTFRQLLLLRKQTDRKSVV